MPKVKAWIASALFFGFFFLFSAQLYYWVSCLWQWNIASLAEKIIWLLFVIPHGIVVWALYALWQDWQEERRRRR